MKRTLIAVAALVAASCVFAAQSPPSYQIHSGPALTAGIQAGTNALIETVVPAGTYRQRDAAPQVSVKALQPPVANKASIGPFRTMENCASVTPMTSHKTTGAFAAQRAKGIVAFT